MTNKEIKAICETQQSKAGDNYPTYKFRITQSKTAIHIQWEYIGLDCKGWTIDTTDSEIYMVKNEHDEIMNDEMEDDTNLTATIQSVVNYMTMRY